MDPQELKQRLDMQRELEAVSRKVAKIITEATDYVIDTMLDAVNFPKHELIGLSRRQARKRLQQAGFQLLIIPGYLGNIVYFATVDNEFLRCAHVHLDVDKMQVVVDFVSEEQFAEFIRNSESWQK